MTQDRVISEAVAVLERFSESDPNQERSAAKRVFAEAVRAWPGDQSEMWWKWLSEAASGLGLRAKAFDCAAGDALEMARDGARFVCFRFNDASLESSWLTVLGRSGKKYRVSSASENEQVVSEKELNQVLTEFQQDDLIRCVVFAQTESTLAVSNDRDTPLHRLWKIIRPERSDLWIVAVFAFFVSLFMLATPIAVEALVNTVAFGRFLQPIIVLSLILLTFLGFQGAIRGLQTYVVEIIQRRMFARVAGDLAFRLPRTEADGTDGYYPPELVNRFFDVVTVQKAVAQLLLDGIGLILSTFIGMAVLGFYHPWLLGFDLFLLASIVLIIFVLGRGAIGSAVKESKHKYYMASWLEDIARCPTAFRNEGGADFALERADRMIHQYLDARRSHFRILIRQILFALGLQAVASTVLLGLGGWLVVSRELTLGQLVAAELIVTAIVGAFTKMGKHLESFYDLLAAVDKLGVLFDLPTERQDGILAIDSTGPAAVKLRSASYTWNDERCVLAPLDIEISPGDRVAFLGSSGTGKTVLADMLYGIRVPTTGRLTIDGFDPRNLKPDVLRNHVARTKSGEMFHATFEENIHLHRADISALDVREVLSEIGLLEPVLQWKHGRDTMLTGDGSPLSESQRRMAEIARAVVGQPRLLIVDGSLDTLGDHDLERCLGFLVDRENPWTLVVLTSREDIAERVGTTISLNALSEAA